MKILSLDQASTVTGWAVFEKGQLVEYGNLSMKKEKNPRIRFYKMCNAIQSLIFDQNPDWIVFEDVALQTNVATLQVLCQIQGAILQMCFSSNIEHYVMSPSSWRKILQFDQGKGIKRADLKKQARDYVWNLYDAAVSEDEADAICMGQAFVTFIGKEKKK